MASQQLQQQQIEGDTITEGTKSVTNRI